MKPVSLFGKLKFGLDMVLRTKMPMLKTGETAPEFSAIDHVGKPISLNDFKGRKLVLWFFPKANTSG